MNNKKVCRVCGAPKNGCVEIAEIGCYACDVCSVIILHPDDWYVEEKTSTPQEVQLTLNLQDEVDKRDNLINDLNTKIKVQQEMIKSQEIGTRALRQKLVGVRTYVNNLTENC